MSYVTRLSPADVVISAFNGTRPTAAALGLNPSSVHQWKKSGRIPEKKKEKILRAARIHGVELSPSDLENGRQVVVS